MARLKQVEVLRQRISEVTGMPIGDIDAQNSRYFESIHQWDQYSPVGHTDLSKTIFSR